MIPREAVEARPRSTVEILDDGWRLYFADPLLLLSLTLFFYLPAVTCLVAILAQPYPASKSWQSLLPALTALLLPLTGLAVGACQEAFHSWSEGYDIGFGECLKAACQRGIYHVASQALALVGPLTVLALWIAPGMATGLRIVTVLAAAIVAVILALFSLTRQPSFAAGKPRFWRAVRHAMRVSGQALDSAILLVTIRGVLFLFAVLNLHLFGMFALWAAESLGGFDVAYVSILCSLDNSVYTLTLILLAWSLLSPFCEACNYLLFVDARTRFEGLDLWNRVQDYFPASQRSQAGAILLALGAGLVLAAPAAAQQPLPAVRAARQDVQAIRHEVKVANPYPGGRPWQAKLEGIAKSLEENAGNRGSFHWFQAALKDFANLNQTQALAFLDDLDNRLAMVEDSLSRPRPQARADAPSAEQIKNLVPPDNRAAAKKKTANQNEPKQKQDKPPPVEDDNPMKGANPVQPAGPPIAGPVALGAGAAHGLLILFIVLFGAALLAALAYVLYSYFRDRDQTPPRQAGVLAPRADDPLDDPARQDPARLWRQADDRARAGDYLGAVRILYLAVLALLHQGGFIRYERTRTNGEYADQLRPRQLLHKPFRGLTSVFEVKWYGERSCEPADYGHCRELAEEIRVGSRQPPSA